MKKRIVCFGDSNTWGYDAISKKRFPENIRWTGRLQNLLGDEYLVIEEGLCGRTTIFDDPLNEGLNGLKYLTPCLNSHAPFDILIIMLGTNDCKQRFSLTARNIADGIKKLIEKAKMLDVWKGYEKILIIAPGPIEKECESSLVAGEMGISSDKSYLLAEEYEVYAKQYDCEFLDAKDYVKMNEIDFMHLDEESHENLAKKIYEIISEKF